MNALPIRSGDGGTGGACGVVSTGLTTGGVVAVAAVVAGGCFGFVSVMLVALLV